MAGLGAVGKHKYATREGEAVSFEVSMEHPEMMVSVFLAALNQEVNWLVLNQQ